MPRLVDKRDTNGREDMWSVSKAIAPFGKNDLDDVKLIQTMLIRVLTSEGFRKDSPKSELTEIDRIFDNSIGRGVQFSDGIYGANTRAAVGVLERDRKSTRLNSSHLGISYAVFCLKKKKKQYKI